MKSLGSARKRGFSMYEMVVSISLLLILSGALVESISSTRRMTVASENKANLQVMGDAALLRMVRELRSSGVQTVGGNEYPHVFDGGQPGVGFDVHAHEPAEGLAEAGDEDFGLDREVVFLVPADADADGRPDIDANGQLQWNASELSYVVMTRADGINYLERRVDGLLPRVVGHHVERLVIDTPRSSAFEIPLNSIRVRLFFRRRDSNGAWTRYSNEAVVALRNG